MSDDLSDQPKSDLLNLSDLPDHGHLKRSSKLFSLLDDLGRLRLLDCAQEVFFPEEDLILTKGEPSDAFYLLLEGIASVYVEGDTKLVEVTRHDAGALFGEISTILGERRAAFVKARSDVRALRFDGEQVAAILDDYPKVREQLVRLGIQRSEDNLEDMVENDFSDMPVTIAEIPKDPPG